MSLPDHRIDHIAGVKALPQLSKQPRLAATLALVRPHGGVEHRAIGERNHSDQPRDRKSRPSGLVRVLRIARLIRPGVRQQDRRPVDQLHVPATPQPWFGRVLSQPHPNLARQLTHHLLRQALASPTVRFRVRGARRQADHQPIHLRFVHSLLTGPVGTDHLTQKHRQRGCRRVHPLAMFWHQRLHTPQQLRSGQQVEEVVGIHFTDLFGHAPLS